MSLFYFKTNLKGKVQFNMQEFNISNYLKVQNWNVTIIYKISTTKLKFYSKSLSIILITLKLHVLDIIFSLQNSHMNTYLNAYKPLTYNNSIKISKRKTYYKHIYDKNIFYYLLVPLWQTLILKQMKRLKILKRKSSFF